MRDNNNTKFNESDFFRTDVRYVFIDIVGFSKIRRADQPIVIFGLNKSIEKVLKKWNHDAPSPKFLRKFRSIGIEQDTLNSISWNHLLLPTGDGMCISIIDGEWDQHLKLAIDIIKELNNPSGYFSKPEAMIKVRIGIHEASDWIYRGVNNAPNVVGVGINYCQRVMDSADPNSIVISSQIYDEHIKETDQEDHFSLKEVIFKHHDSPTKVYKYKNKSLKFLNSSEPDLSKQQLTNSFRLLGNVISNITDNSNGTSIMPTQFRIDHEIDVLKCLVEQGYVPLPIRNAHAYKRYVFGNILKMLKTGYEYSTISNLEFWMPGDIGYSRSVDVFIDRNIEVCSNGGVLVRRVILIPDLRLLSLDSMAQQKKLGEHIKSLYNKLISRGINTTEKLFEGQLSKNVAGLLAEEKLINLFVIKNSEVIRILEEELNSEEIPHAFIRRDDDKELMVVELTASPLVKQPGRKNLQEDADNPMTIRIDCKPENKELFEKHERALRRIFEIGVKKSSEIRDLLLS